ncbi:MAG: M48 family metallopeptidase [Longimicrobiales bacterium]
MQTRILSVLLMTLMTGAGVAVYFGRRDGAVNLAAPRELFADGLLDATQAAKRLLPISEPEEMRIGRESVAALAAIGPEDATHLSRVESTGRRLEPHVHRKGIRYEYHALSDATENAFSLPGGQVALSTGMLALVQSDDELAAVIGHEIAHIDQRHSIDRYRQLPRLTIAGDLARWLIVTGYSQFQELDADLQGARMCEQAGYDPRAAVAVFQRLMGTSAPEPERPAKTPLEEIKRAAAGAAGAYFMSHPAPQERIRRLRARWP